MKKNHYVLLIAALSFTLIGCSSDDDDGTTAGATTDGAATDGASTDGASTDGASTDGASTDGATTDGASTDGATTDGAAVSYQISVTNRTTGQLMTPPVVAIHDASVNLFAVGELAEDRLRDIAERGDNAAMVQFATDPDNASLVSAAEVIGTAPFGPGDAATVSTTLTTTEPSHVLSLVNMIICTNDGISGLNSQTLPTDNTPMTFDAKAYDAGTRQNQENNNSFIPGMFCRADGVDEEPAPLEDPRQGVAAHPGQSNITVPDGLGEAGDWDFAADANVMTVVITRN